MGEVPLLLLLLLLPLWLCKFSQHWRVCHVCHASQAGDACFGCCFGLACVVCWVCAWSCCEGEWVNACMKSSSPSSSEPFLCLPLSLFGDQSLTDSFMEPSYPQAWGLRHTTGWLQLGLHGLVCPCGELVWPRLLNNVIVLSLLC